MRKAKSLLVFFLLSVGFIYAQEPVNQTDANGHKQGRWIGKYPNGSIRYEGSFVNDRPIGDWKRFHENGRIKAQIRHYPNSLKSSAELFDIGGIRYAKGIYNGTVKDSTWNYFNNLRLVGKESYVDGVKNGYSVYYFENGNPAIETTWANGKLNGASRSYYPSGKVKTETMFRDGKRQGLMLSYYESGHPEIIGKYDNDQADGTWKFTDKGGSIKYELQYKSGVLLNPEVIERIQSEEFKAFDRARGRIKDPADYTQSPEEYLRK